MTDRAGDLARIAAALTRAGEILERFTPGRVEHRQKGPGDPVTEADTAVDAMLRATLPREGEGWLSEETADGAERLGRERVWIVDPLDGTREFVAGIPEWCVSIGLVEAGRPVAGGILNPVAGLRVLGAAGAGVTANGEPVRPRAVADLGAAEILASRSEVRRGEWERFSASGLRVRPTGSVAWKLALVAAGRADATWTLVPKHEWDVAAGVALVLAAGGEVWVPGAGAPAFNQPRPRLSGLCASTSTLAPAIRDRLAAHAREAAP